jgi:hypothetical protein
MGLNPFRVYLVSQMPTRSHDTKSNGIRHLGSFFSKDLDLQYASPILTLD